MIETIKSLQFEKKLLPKNNPEISWCIAFFPALCLYFVLLTQYINAKPKIGEIEVFSPEFRKLIYPDTNFEVIANGSVWSEGPLWIEDESASLSYLIYSDTILNTISRWDEGKGFFTVGKTLLFSQSGCKQNETVCEERFEPGSNGILRPLKQHLPQHSAPSVDVLVCQHGERAISFFRENGTRSFIATHFRGRKLNSPNDLIWSSEGHLYFTDPPYGLYSKNKTITDRQIPFSGIYMIKADDIKESIRTGIPTTELKLLHKDMRRPNGLAFSPDFSKLYVSNSDPTNAIWNVFDVTDSGNLANGRLLFNATDMLVSGNETGLPDGFRVDLDGNLFASGPGGILVISPEGEILGRFRLDRSVSNVAFGGDGRLYATASDLLVRMWVKAKPVRIIERKK